MTETMHDLFSTLQDLHSPFSNDLTCPKCNSTHVYTPASSSNDSSMSDLRVFHNGSHVRCFGCKQESSQNHPMQALTCGHLFCTEDYNKLSCIDGNATGKKDCPTCEATTSSSTADLCSHKARAVWILGREQCPICWEDFTSNDESPSNGVMMIALACGHTFCPDDFKRLGGKMGPDALVSLEEIRRRQEEQVQRLRERHGKTVKALIRQLSSSNEADVRVALILLAYATACTTGETTMFLQRGGPAAIVKAMKSYRYSRMVQELANNILRNLLCTEHRPSSELIPITSALANADVFSVYIDMFRDEQTPIAILLSSARQVRRMFNTELLLTKMLSSKRNKKQLKSLIRAIVQTMERYPDSALLQAELIDSFKALTLSNEKDDALEHKRGRLVADAKGIEAIISSGQRFGNDSLVQENVVGALCHLCFSKDLIAHICQLGGIKLVCTALQTHGAAWFVQRNGSNFLYAVANCMKKDQKVVEKALAENRAVELIRDTIASYGADKEMLSCCFSTLGNIIDNFRSLALLQLTRLGCIELVAKALQDFSDLENYTLLYNGTRLLQYFADSNENEIRLKLTMTDVIPALQMIQNKVEYFSMARMRGVDLSTLPPFFLMVYDELLNNVLGQLGVLDIDIINDPEYDFDDEEDEHGEIESPPFDVDSILDQDLSVTPPGWYKNNEFYVSFDHSTELAKKYKKKSFLIPPLKPAVGQDVAIRVKLPFGGRGYLYGSISSIGPAPSDDELRASGSRLFEKGCPCTRPDCELKNGTRDEILASFGAVAGQQCIATVCLDSPYFLPKLRFEPLPAFFKGKRKQYSVVLCWDESDASWNVVKISNHEN